jgi:hypothetical protein
MEHVLDFDDYTLLSSDLNLVETLKIAREDPFVRLIISHESSIVVLTIGGVNIAKNTEAV